MKRSVRQGKPEDTLKKKTDCLMQRVVYSLLNSLIQIITFRDPEKVNLYSL